jgi:hypothetical protein
MCANWENTLKSGAGYYDMPVYTSVSHKLYLQVLEHTVGRPRQGQGMKRSQSEIFLHDAGLLSPFDSLIPKQVITRHFFCLFYRFHGFTL